MFSGLVSPNQLDLFFFSFNFSSLSCFIFSPVARYVGLLPTMVRNSSTVAFRMLLYDVLVQRVPNPFASGFLVGAISTVLNNPIDVWQQQQQQKKEEEKKKKILQEKQAWNHQQVWTNSQDDLFNCPFPSPLFFLFGTGSGDQVADAG
jgi:hypothetical protein